MIQKQMRNMGGTMYKEKIRKIFKKNNWTKILAAGCLAAVVVLVLLFVFYNRDNEAENMQAEEKTVLIVTFASGDDGWNKSVSLACDAFMEKYPEIEVKLQPSTRTQSGFYDDYLKRQTAIGELGDVVEIKDIKMAYQEGMFCPLPDELTELLQDTWTAPDGCVYTLPGARLEQGMIYNKAVFDALGLTPPATWEEFEVLCETLKEKQYTPLVVGGGDSWHLMFWCRYFFNSCVTSSNPTWQSDCTSGKTSWTDAEPTEMLERFTGLFEKGYVNSGYATTSDAETCEYIANGNAVMLYSLCNQIPKIQSLNPEMELGWFFMPDDEGQKYSFTDNQSGWGISAECRNDEKKYDAAVKFLKFFYSEEIYGEICSLMNALPVTKKEMPLENEQLKEINEEAGGVLKPEMQIGDEDTPEGFRNFLCAGLKEVLNGEKTKEEILREYQNEWERAVTDAE